MNSSSDPLKCFPNETKRMNDQMTAESNVSIDTLVRTDANMPVPIQCQQQQDFHSFRLVNQQPYQNQQHYTDYLMYPQHPQFALINSGAGAGELCSTSWSSSEPLLYSMMPGEIEPSEPNVCVAFTMNQQRFAERSGDNNHPTHSSEQVVMMNPDPGPVFVTLENASIHTNDFCHEEVVTTLPHGPGAGPELDLLYAAQNAAVNLERHSQVGCPSYVKEQTAQRPHTDTLIQSFQNFREPRSRKPCHCTKSRCLKLYCDCFSNGVMCSYCNCTNCNNNTEHEATRGRAIKTCLQRNPNAFRSKISGGKSGELKGKHCKGCNCKRSGCLKNYCECYEANISCTHNCKCVGCRNNNGNLMDRSLSEKYQVPTSVITSAVLETVTGCLLSRAAEAEREQRSEAWGQHEILTEFGQCLTQITQAMFNNYTY